MTRQARSASRSDTGDTHVMTRLYQPVDAAQMLGIASSTLRTWAPRYSEFLSDQANRGRRTFTPRDIAVLRAVKSMADENMTHDEIAARLPALEFPEDDAADLADEAPAGDASAQGATVALVMATQQLADQSQRLTQQDAQIAALTEAVYTLRNDLALMQRDLEAAQRRLDALGDTVAGTEGKVDSVGEAMHRHTGPVSWFTSREG